MSTLSVRLPNSLHEAVRKLAKEEGTSINQFVTIALAEKIAALMTEQYLQQRASRASRARFEAAMAKVSEDESPAYDRLPGEGRAP